MRLLALLALFLTALPASAQAARDSDSERPATERTEATVDPNLVGEWRLLQVEEAGEIGTFGGEIKGMDCDFEAGGSAHVRLEVMQDLDLQEHAEAFPFETEGGAIVRPGAPPVRYEVLGEDLLVLRDPTGLVVHLVRVEG
ncbi:hypothetical protein RQM47_05490 [Rubrivirga sp. S365]|uniref:Lipocalin-like domain-containing protein n=1 Tax=Rubrivirga litoralis TaxID=3075598 RepID=A0ABU3BR54_9BACT|nr:MULTISPECIES: hypothetical protein [unclassified Rubrivirga]MDT0631749.1 hypothetical protein [Rubrivirga sp. F394]MDT7856086.1 hypothetical protein [Rubrivirga sp. S365]